MSTTQSRVTWFEITGQDHATLQTFYGGLFGWEFSQEEGLPTYGLVAGESGRPVGGVGSLPGGASWTTFYVEVEDLDAAMARAEQLGAKLLLPLTEQGPNRFCVVADPEGHPIGLVQHGMPA